MKILYTWPFLILSLHLHNRFFSLSKTTMLHCCIIQFIQLLTYLFILFFIRTCNTKKHHGMRRKSVQIDTINSFNCNVNIWHILQAAKMLYKTSDRPYIMDVCIEFEQETEHKIMPEWLTLLILTGFFQHS